MKVRFVKLFNKLFVTINKMVIFLLELTTEWVTISEYCKRFGIENTQTITNLFKREIIPEEDVHVFPELNNLRMIRTKNYKVHQR